MKKDSVWYRVFTGLKTCNKNQGVFLEEGEDGTFWIYKGDPEKGSKSKEAEVVGGLLWDAPHPQLTLVGEAASTFVKGADIIKIDAPVTTILSSLRDIDLALCENSHNPEHPLLKMLRGIIQNLREYPETFSHLSNLLTEDKDKEISRLFDRALNQALKKEGISIDGVDPEKYVFPRERERYEKIRALLIKQPV